MVVPCWHKWSLSRLAHTVPSMFFVQDNYFVVEGMFRAVQVLAKTAASPQPVLACRFSSVITKIPKRFWLRTSQLLPMTSTSGHRSIIIKTVKIISWPEDASWIRREMSPLTSVSPDEQFHLFLIFWLSTWMNDNLYINVEILIVF